MAEKKSGRPECHEDCLFGVSGKCHHAYAGGCQAGGSCDLKVKIKHTRKCSCAVANGHKLIKGDEPCTRS